MTPDLERALAAVGRVLADAREPWWIVGSAAVALHGVDTPVADVDVLLSTADADELIVRLGLVEVAPDADARFRSERFVRWAQGDRDVELMVGLKVCDDGDWRPIQPGTRVAFNVGGVRVFTPDRLELCDILRRFGRSKDRERLCLLQGCTGAPG